MHIPAEELGAPPFVWHCVNPARPPRSGTGVGCDPGSGLDSGVGSVR